MWQKCWHELRSKGVGKRFYWVYDTMLSGDLGHCCQLHLWLVPVTSSDLLCLSLFFFFRVKASLGERHIKHLHGVLARSMAVRSGPVSWGSSCVEVEKIKLMRGRLMAAEYEKIGLGEFERKSAQIQNNRGLNQHSLTAKAVPKWPPPMFQREALTWAFQNHWVVERWNIADHKAVNASNCPLHFLLTV